MEQKKRSRREGEGSTRSTIAPLRALSIDINSFDRSGSSLSLKLMNFNVPLGTHRGGQLKGNASGSDESHPLVLLPMKQMANEMFVDF